LGVQIENIFINWIIEISNNLAIVGQEPRAPNIILKKNRNSTRQVP